MHSRTLAIAVCCVILGSRVWAASIEDLERQLRSMAAERRAAERERTRLVAEAASLADAIGDLQNPLGNRARASASLERQLRQFDRLTANLDATDRKLKTYETASATLRQAFLVELDRETRQLAGQGDPRAAAARASELEAARRRVNDLGESSVSFRPLLVVSAAPTDTVADLDQKLAVLAAERTRGTGSIAALDRELSVLAGRAIMTRRLVDALESAARSAPQDLRLVQRQVDEVQSGLRDLNRRQLDLRRVRETFVMSLADLEKRVTECEQRRRALLRLDPGGRQ